MGAFMIYVGLIIVAWKLHNIEQALLAASRQKDQPHD